MDCGRAHKVLLGHKRWMLVVCFLAQSAWGWDWKTKAKEALGAALTEMGVTKGDSRLLVLTNAGYGQIGDESTEVFLDLVAQETGCTIGARSLIPVHSSIQEPLWFSVFRKDSKKLLYFKWSGDGFKHQIIDARQENILSPEGWTAASSGLIGKNLFSVLSISLTWDQNPPWQLLMAGSFHDHFCPGLNAGYIFALYILTKLPLGPGDQYVTVTAPGRCPADGLAMLLNTTGGKQAGYVMSIGEELLVKYAQGSVQPFVVAMKVNRKADTCEGIVLGFDWDRVLVDTGVKREHFYSKGGPDDPWFWVSRVKASVELAKMSKEKLLGYAVELKRFSGKSAMVEKVASGDPYSVIWAQ